MKDGSTSIVYDNGADDGDGGVEEVAASASGVAEEVAVGAETLESLQSDVLALCADGVDALSDEDGSAWPAGGLFDESA